MSYLFVLIVTSVFLRLHRTYVLEYFTVWFMRRNYLWRCEWKHTNTNIKKTSESSILIENFNESRMVKIVCCFSSPALRTQMLKRVFIKSTDKNRPFDNVGRHAAMSLVISSLWLYVFCFCFQTASSAIRCPKVTREAAGSSSTTHTTAIGSLN